MHGMLLKPAVALLSILVVLQVLGVPVFETVTGVVGGSLDAAYRYVIETVAGWMP